MRANIIRLSAQWDSAARQLQGCNSLEIVTIGTRHYIIAAGEADGGLSSYEIMPDGSLVAVYDILGSASSGTLAVRGLTSYGVGGFTYLIPSGRYDNNTTIYRVEGDGALTALSQYTNAHGAFANLVSTYRVEFSTATYVYSVNAQGGGIGISQINSDGTLGNISFFADSASHYINDVSTMSHAVLHGQNFMFAGSTFDAGIEAFLVNPDGSLTTTYAMEDSEIGFFNPSAMAALQIGARAFMVMGATGTDELVVLRVSQGGKMKVVDRLVDTNDTRFEQVSTIKLFQYEGRDLLLAAGSDDGFTILEIDHRGRLHHVTTIADDFDTTLDNLADLEIVELDGRLFVFAASPTEHGFTQFELFFTTPQIINGGRNKQTLVGTAGDDVINGYGGRDIIDGGAGNDILIDGRGKDFLTGGEGADVFRFRDDGKKDVITDFEIGIDKIDLTDFSMLYTHYDLDIRSRIDGALLVFGDDQFRIYSADGGRIEVSDFQATDFIFS